jgi:hypothetical protein
VLDTNAAPQPYATISYSWNTEPDASWRTVINEGNPFLDPFHVNKEFASELMAFWYQMYQVDGNYAKRILRHYRELRDAVGMKFTTEEGSGMHPDMDEALNSIIDSTLSENTKLRMVTASIKKKAQACYKVLQQKRAARRKPK